MSALAYVAIDVAPSPVARACEAAQLVQPVAAPTCLEPSDEFDTRMFRVEHVMAFDLQT